MEALLTMFGAAFDDRPTYGEARPETVMLPRNGQSVVKKQTFRTERRYTIEVSEYRHVVATGFFLIGKDANQLGESGAPIRLLKLCRSLDDKLKRFSLRSMLQ